MLWFQPELGVAVPATPAPSTNACFLVTAPQTTMPAQTQRPRRAARGQPVDVRPKPPNRRGRGGNQSAVEESGNNDDESQRSDDNLSERNESNEESSTAEPSIIPNNPKYVAAVVDFREHTQRNQANESLNRWKQTLSRGVKKHLWRAAKFPIEVATTFAWIKKELDLNDEQLKNDGKTLKIHVNGQIRKTRNTAIDGMKKEYLCE